MSLRLVRLKLARTQEHPEGSPKHGYEFIAPLADDWHIDMALWKEYGQARTMLRFWGEEDDEPIYHFASHAFVAGEYVTITEHDGTDQPFMVIWIHEPSALRGDQP